MRLTERVTIALTPRVVGELEQLQRMTGLSKTDLVNRALSLYLFVEQIREQENQLAVYDPTEANFRLVHIT